MIVDAGNSPMLRQIIRNPIQLAPDGMTDVPQGPRLNIDTDEKAVAKFSID
jgi:L-rhamnonate dehydratase